MYIPPHCKPPATTCLFPLESLADLIPAIHMEPVLKLFKMDRYLSISEDNTRSCEVFRQSRRGVLDVG